MHAIPFQSRRAHRIFFALLALLCMSAPAFAQTTPVWQFAGPQPLSAGTTYGNVAGRIAALAADPFQASVIFAGGMGGVWKTTDGGLTWQPLTTTVSATAVGALAFDPQQPGVVYAGTGDPNGAQESYAGLGLLFSSDEGQHWSTLGTVDFAGLAISRIAIDPANSKHLLVAAVTAQDSPSGVQPGLYESTDGGQTWAMPGGLSTGEAWDFAWDPTHGVVIAAIGTHLYRSADSGASFTVLSGSTIPSVITRAALCALPGTTDFLVVTADAQFNLGALLQSSDDGQTWTSLTGPPNLFGPSGAGQGFYDIAITADPANAQHWWLGGVNVWETKNGGSTWTSLGSTYTGQHALFLAGGLLWIGNDGGVWNEDSSGNLHNLNAGLPNLGLQSLAVSSALSGKWATALQIGLIGRSSSSASWNVLQRDGGGTLAIAPNATQPLVFVAPQLTGIETSTDGGQHFTNPIPATTAVSNTPLADSANAPWLVPVAADPNHSGTLYVGSWRIWKSTDAGASWTVLAGSETTGSIAAITVSPADSNTVYAATSTGSILVSSDAGATWTTASATGLPARPLTGLRAAADNAQHLWAALGGRNATAPSGHVFISSDGGATWTSHSSGLPDAPVHCLLLDPLNPNAAYAALSNGVYATADGGSSWQPLGTGLPLVPVNDLQLDSNHNLLAATFDRGVWSLALPTGSQQVTAISGGGQSGTVGASLAQPLTVQVTSSTGAPVAGMTVQWSDGSTQSIPSSTTDSQGMASLNLNYKLPTKSGSIKINATIQYLNSNGSTGTSTASFSETANPGAPFSLTCVGGCNQSGQVSTRLAQDLGARVADTYGNGVPNIPVTFSDGTAGGSFSSAMISTDATGLAADGYTLPSTPGAVTVTASSSNLKSISFSLTANLPPDFQWQPVKGPLSVQQNGALTVTLQTTAVGGDAAPISLLCLQPATGCSFSPNPVTPGAAATLSLPAGALAAGATNTVVVQGSDGVHTHSLQFDVTVVMPPGLLLSSDPGQMTLAAGGQGAFTLSLTPQGGLSGPVQLSVAGANAAALPAGMTVSFAPSAPTLAGASLSDTLKIVTTSRVLASQAWPMPTLPWQWGGALLGLLLMLGMVRARRRLPALALGLLLLTASACGGGGAAPAYRAPSSTVNPNGTPAGAYPLTITATCGSVSVSTQVTVTVN